MAKSHAGNPGAPEIDPCVPLKEQSQDWKDWKTGPLIRNTPLVPCRHGGGYICIDICIHIDIYIYISIYILSATLPPVRHVVECL